MRDMHGKYRVRTRLRGHLPYALLWLAPKGKHDCGAHEWYRAYADTWHCYHCEPGAAHGNPRSKGEPVMRSIAKEPARTHP